MTKFVFPIAFNSLKLTSGSAADDSNDIRRAEGGGRRAEGGGRRAEGWWSLHLLLLFFFSFYAMHLTHFFLKKGISFL